MGEFVLRIYDWDDTFSEQDLEATTKDGAIQEAEKYMRTVWPNNPDLNMHDAGNVRAEVCKVSSVKTIETKLKYDRQTERMSVVND